MSSYDVIMPSSDLSTSPRVPNDMIIMHAKYQVDISNEQDFRDTIFLVLLFPLHV